jgi:hypothetical protein
MLTNIILLFSFCEFEQTAMATYWTNFAKYGDLNGNGLLLLKN